MISENAIQVVLAELAHRYPKHKFEPRVEVRFVVDGRYLTRMALTGIKISGFEHDLVRMFDADMVEVEQGLALHKEAKRVAKVKA